ncbi:cytochrome P450 [Actinophytocola oryzae]|uniref:Cytochrome P450 n=1 Tax=Actinophytocola oryzae TaxID=502181 RepID=A0A4R7V2Z2_9PSEU|nr:cytochrome P450 [Actinophytocola oryzae]TDV43220.1 cytochrome P450 [Actinophytocola oryzae]
MTERVVLDRYADAQDAYRRKELRQAQYDDADVVMADVLVNLHGTEHRDRRRVENTLFRRATFDHFEREVFPDVIDGVLAPGAEAGRTELVHAGHRMMLHVAALVAGLDLDATDVRAVDDLQGQLSLFTEALTLKQSKLDKEERRAAIERALVEWTDQFYSPARRKRLETRRTGGEPSRDVLSVLLDHQDDLGLPDDVLRRETAFFLLVAAHTSATAFVRSAHHVLEWLTAHPGDVDRLRTDPYFAQRCVHETLRLNSSSNVGMRRAAEAVTLRSGVVIPRDSLVVIDLRAVNRDTDVFGADAAEFDPDRVIPHGVPPYGLTFAAGMHVCIGQDLAAGVVQRGGAETPDGHLFGLITLAVRRLFELDVRLDPADPPVRDTTTERVYWARYPVLLSSVDARAPRVDRESCVGSGRCVTEEPTAFRFGPDDLAEATPAAASLPPARLREIAFGCPAAAIHVED